MSKLSWVEARALVAVLERVGAPFIENELKLVQDLRKAIEEDGDLTGIPVSNTSRTYPNAAYGHMDDEIRLGYQAGVTSLRSPPMDACGSRWSIMRATRFLAPRRKRWCWLPKKGRD